MSLDIKAILEEGRWISNERIGPIQFIPYGKGSEFYRRHYPIVLDLPHPDSFRYHNTIQATCIALRDQLGYAAYRKGVDGPPGGFECGYASLWHRDMMHMYFKHEEHAVLTRVMLL